MKSKRLTAIVAALVCLGVLSLGFGYYKEWYHPYKMVTYYTNAHGSYRCSQPVKMHWASYTVAPVEGENPVKVSGYLPTDQSAAERVCRLKDTLQ
jgi:hypothetical protein